ncbi:MAG: hypothetical protein ACRCSF_08945 [Mycobacteriaceae bacterium]
MRVQLNTRTSLLGVPLLLFFLGAAACSSAEDIAQTAQSSGITSGETSTATTSSAVPPDTREQPWDQSEDRNSKHEAFAQCMLENGVTLPQPHEADHPRDKYHDGESAQGHRVQGPPAPAGVDENTWQSALTACEALAPVEPHGKATG